jgi:hypothetical protein
MRILELGQRSVVLLGIVLVMSLTLGAKAYLMIQLPILLLAMTAGAWLFYVQGRKAPYPRVDLEIAGDHPLG